MDRQVAGQWTDRPPADGQAASGWTDRLPADGQTGRLQGEGEQDGQGASTACVLRLCLGRATLLLDALTLLIVSPQESNLEVHQL